MSSTIPFRMVPTSGKLVAIRSVQPHVAHRAALELRIEQVMPRCLYRLARAVRPVPPPLWHSRQTVKTTGRRSSLWFIEPCGLWQVSQPSARTGDVQRQKVRVYRRGTSGRRFVRDGLLHHSRPHSRPPRSGECSVRIVTIGALHKAFVDTVLGRHLELRANRVVASVAELVLLLAKRYFGVVEW